jgi:hypothetical protein
MQLKIRLAALSRSNVYVADHTQIGALVAIPAFHFPKSRPS